MTVGESVDLKRLALASLISVLPFGAAFVSGIIYVALMAPALAGVMIRLLGSWRGWTWVAATVTVGATLWGGIFWLQANAHCTATGPAVPALMVGLSVLVGALVGARVAGPSGSGLRVVAAAAIGAVTAAVLAALTAFLGGAFGIPTLLVSFSHC